jgi:hypothetical protein
MNDNNINFDNIKIIKILGTGAFGMAYLVKYNKNNYALKVNNILLRDKNKNFESKLWRELDLYYYINNLKLSEQCFFTKLYGYKIFNNCNHKQIRHSEIDLNDKKNKLAVILKELDESNTCVKFLIEYKGTNTLHKYLCNKIPTVKQTYSLILQICNMTSILYKGGYSQNDLNTENIMVNIPTEKTFIFFNKKIPFNGLHISMIDYGEVLHKKFKLPLKGYRELFIRDRTKYLFDDIYSTIMVIVTNYDKYTYNCKINKKSLPNEHKINSYENGFKQIVIKHKIFYENTKKKYIKIYPNAIKLINNMEKNINNSPLKTIGSILDKQCFWYVIERIVDEFRILYPKLHMKYFQFCSYHKCNLPEKDILDIMLMTNINELFNYCINKIK